MLYYILRSENCPACLINEGKWVTLPLCYALWANAQSEVLQYCSKATSHSSHFIRLEQDGQHLVSCRRATTSWRQPSLMRRWMGTGRRSHRSATLVAGASGSSSAAVRRTIVGDKLVRTVMVKVAWDGGIRNLFEGRRSHFPRQKEEGSLQVGR